MTAASIIVTTTIGALKEEMKELGWKNGGITADVKLSGQGSQIAKYGSPAWMKDIQNCLQKIKYKAIVAELEKRGDEKE